MAISFARILRAGVETATNAIMARVIGTEDETGDDPLFGPIGLLTRPHKLVDDKSGTGLRPTGYVEAAIARIGDRVLGLAFRDLRLNARAGALVEGDVVLIQWSGATIRLRDATGGTNGASVTIEAPTLNGSGVVTKMHTITMDPTTNKVTVLHADGVRVEIDNTKCTVHAGGASHQVVLWDDLNAWVSEVNAAFGTIAGAAGLNPNPSITAPTSVPKAAAKLYAE